MTSIGVNFINKLVIKFAMSQEEQQQLLTPRFLNFSPIDVTILNVDGQKVTFPSLGAAQVEEEQVVLDENLGGFAIRKTNYTKIKGLPPIVDDREGKSLFYIVSMVVAQANALSSSPRKGLLSPDSGVSAVRGGERNQISYVTGLLRWD
jgi:hypothetical protein